MNEKDQRNYDLRERLIEFAVRVLNVVESLPNSRVGNHVAGQLLRSGTSPAPNYGEAQSAESRKDFIHTFFLSHSSLLARYSIFNSYGERVAERRQ
jgi:four helix bundle protein